MDEIGSLRFDIHYSNLNLYHQYNSEAKHSKPSLTDLSHRWTQSNPSFKKASDRILIIIIFTIIFTKGSMQQSSVSYRSNRMSGESRKISAVNNSSMLHQQQIEDLERKVDMILIHNSKLI